MKNNTDMKQYLDPKFIYTASIRVRNGDGYQFRKAYAVNKDILRNYAKWVDVSKFELTETFELSDGCLSKEALQLDSCESLTKQEFRDYLGKDCKFMPGELAIAKDDNKYAITTNGWQGGSAGSDSPVRHERPRLGCARRRGVRHSVHGRAICVQNTRRHRSTAEKYVCRVRQIIAAPARRNS